MSEDLPDITYAEMDWPARIRHFSALAREAWNEGHRDPIELSGTRALWDPGTECVLFIGTETTLSVPWHIVENHGFVLAEDPS